MRCIDLSNRNLQELYDIWKELSNINPTWKLSMLISLTENNIKLAFINSQSIVIALTRIEAPLDIIIVGVDTVVPIEVMQFICDHVMFGHSDREIKNPETEEVDIELDMDKILDKISKLGIESLTKNEKGYLDNKASQ